MATLLHNSAPLTRGLEANHSPRRHRPVPSRLLIPKAALPPPTPTSNRRQFLTDSTATALSVAVAPLVGFGEDRAARAEEGLSEWERVYLPIDPGVVLLDIAFVPDDPSHGQTSMNFTRLRIFSLTILDFRKSKAQASRRIVRSKHT